MPRRADGNVAKVLVFGSNTSGTSARQVRQVCPPEDTSARPSGSVVDVGYHRRYAMFGSADHDCVTGSKMFALAAPRDGGSYPPTTRILPSASCDCPAQNRL